MTFHAFRTWAVLTLLACLTLTGCANIQPPVPLDQQFWNAKEPTIGVAITVVPPPVLALTGNQGILDYAINKGVNSKLSDNVEKWQVRDLNTLPDVIVAKLEAKGYKVKRINEPVNLESYKKVSFREGYTVRDLTPLKATYGVDRLLLVGMVVILAPLGEEPSTPAHRGGSATHISNVNIVGTQYPKTKTTALAIQIRP
mgnify:CR=1 FL=1